MFPDIFPYDQYDKLPQDVLNPRIAMKNNKGKHTMRRIINKNTKEVYSSVTEAAQKIGCHVSNIQRCLNGTYKTAGGYKWEYA
jgi:hypothetical protein